MREYTFILIVVFLIIIVSVSADNIDNEVEEKLEDGEDVAVIIMLKENPIKEDYSEVVDKNVRRSLDEKIIRIRRNVVRRNQNNVLSELRLKDIDVIVGRRTLSSENYDFELKHSYSVINGFSGKVTKEGLERLRENPDVEMVYYDSVRQLSLDVSVPQINATSVWALQPNGLNLTGVNQTVCVVDSGIDYTHANLGNCSEANFTNGTCSKVIGGWDYKNNDNNPRDD